MYKRQVLVPDSEMEAVEKEITELTGGRAGMEWLEAVYYGVVDKEVVLF